MTTTHRRWVSRRIEGGRCRASASLDFSHRLSYRRGSRAGGTKAWVAQLVEQRIENPRVGGSNPPPGTTSLFNGRAFFNGRALSHRRRVRFRAAVCGMTLRFWFRKHNGQRRAKLLHRSNAMAPILAERGACSASRLCIAQFMRGVGKMSWNESATALDASALGCQRVKTASLQSGKTLSSSRGT